MANLNLPGHSSNPIFIFSYLLYTKKTYLLLAGPGALGKRGQHGTAGDGLG